jgi:hypothetical protein
MLGCDVKQTKSRNTKQNRLKIALRAVLSPFINQLEFTVSKLLQDEKVAALVDKQVTRAVKAETKRVLWLIKELAMPEDKAAAKATKEVLKNLMAGVKEAA